MTTTEPAKRFAALVKRLHTAHDVSPVDPAQASRPEQANAILWQLVFSILAWECSPTRAANPTGKLHGAVIDYNEMRVCLPDELASMIGDRYPRARERAVRLRSVLNDIFRREHSVTLDHLVAMNKRDARAYLDGLEGCPPYAAARVALLELDGHAMPVDDRLLAVLRDEDAVPENSTPQTAAAWLERQLRAGEARATYLMLEAWAAEHPPTKKGESKDADSAGPRSESRGEPASGGKSEGRSKANARAKRGASGEGTAARSKRSSKA